MSLAPQVQKYASRLAQAPPPSKHRRTVNLVLPAMWGKVEEPNTQQGFVRSPAREAICVAGSKSGKTFGCSVWIIERMLNDPGPWFWAGPVYRQARIGLDLVARILPKAIRQISESTMRITIANGSTCDFRSCEDPDNLFGFAYKGGVIDEGSRIRDRAWQAIQTWTHRSRGPIRIIANAKGKRNWFYREWDRANRGEPGMSAHKLLSSQNPFIPLEVLEEAKRHLPDQVYRELYEAEFLDQAASPFSNWAACVDRNITASPRKGQAYIGGVDFGRHQSYTVAIVGTHDGTAVNIARWQGVPWHVTRTRLHRLSDAYGGVSWLVDASGVGDSVAEDLERSGLRIDEFKFSEKSKAGLIGDLIGDVEAEDIHFPDWQQLGHELEVIEGTRLKSGLWSYRAPETDFDDCVMALGLFNRKRKQDAGITGNLIYV